LRGVAVTAEGELRLGQQVRRARLGAVDGVAGEAVDGRRVRVRAGVARDAVGRRVVAGQAGLVGAGQAGGLVDLVLVAARFDVRLAVAMARFADGVRHFI